MICGTRGNPDTVAPFRAWRGSRDLVARARSSTLSAARALRAAAKKSLAHSVGVEMWAQTFSRNVAKRLSINSYQSSAIQFAVEIRNGECLPAPPA